MFTPHLRCRACGFGPLPNAHYFKAGEQKDQLISILDLGPMPLANAFSRGMDPRPGYYPLELMFCPRCTLGQLSVVVDPATLYSHYAYVTSTSQIMEDHLTKLYDFLNHHQPLKTVVEIGSNDGRCLQHFKKLGSEIVLGIDPAENLSKIANDSGVPTIPLVFGAKAAEEAKKIVPNGADLILARHVFCHVDDWKEFFRSAEALSNSNTILCIEAPWAHDMLQSCEWDTIYHEHLSYLTLRSLEKALESTEFRLHCVERFSVHGGALAVILRRRDHPEGILPCVSEYLFAEHCTLEHWRSFAVRARDQMNNLKITLDALRQEKKRVAGYGASAKASTWIGALKLTKKDICGIYDCTQQKQYSTVPGSDIQVIPEGGFFVDGPDYAVCWAWNFLDEILRKNSKWISQGGKFIVPVPEVRIVGAN